MSDDYVEVTNRSFGDNLFASIKGVIVGVVLFFAAFPILWWNEGRTDLSTVAKTAVVVNPDGSSKQAGEGKLVSVTGKLAVDGTIGDPDYLKPGSYVTLDREVEMYAWVETKETRTEKKLGGGSREVTTYSYDRKWTDHPQDSSEFRYPEEHENPGLEVHARSFTAPVAQVGVYKFEPSDVELPSSTPIALTPALITRGSRLNGDYIYQGKGSIKAPVLGDLRISFSAVLPGKTVTLYGEQQGTTVIAFMHEGKDKLHRVVNGTHAEAIATLHAEHTATTWLLRALGFVLMWIGLGMTLGPFNAVLDIVPFVGSTGRMLVTLFMFPIAMALSVATIVISMIAHNPILLVVVTVAILGGAGFWLRARRRARRA
jgi:hypothetical protein